MAKKTIVGILKEVKNRWEKRAPLTPGDVGWLVRKGIGVEVESNPLRVFSDREYREAGAKVVKKLDKASLLVGIKEPPVKSIKDGSTYMLFSHTIKGQAHNMPLLRKFIDKKDTLIDFERITDNKGKRLVFFGRFAGICGMVDSLHYIGQKMEHRGVHTPLRHIDPAWRYGCLKEIKKDLRKLKNRIKREGFDEGAAPFIVGVTGCGNVSRGAHEILDQLDPVEIRPAELPEFMRKGEYSRNTLYKVAIFREDKLRSKDGSPFTFEEYLSKPGDFKSRLDEYLPHLNMLAHTSYWDERYPRLVPKKMIRRLSRKKDFRLEFIGDISCDVKGSIEITERSTSPDNAVFTYDPRRDSYTDGLSAEGITLLAVDNLPAELPRDSSESFSALIRDHIYRVASRVDGKDIPEEIRRAVIAESGQLAGDYSYLKRFISEER